MTEALERLLLGRTLAGRYEIREVIGRGGMSVVYSGTDGTLGRPVAVKLISLPAASEDMRAHLRERFRREAGSAARIPPHPNVVQIYDYGTDPELDIDFIIMELLEGRDLKEALAVSPPSRDEAVRVLREAARGLSAGHRVGIVHRDVKPANVFLAGRDRFESVRILDFGIAKPVTGRPGEDDLTLGGQLPHSPAYASPEQVDPDRPVTFASDVYQLGLIGYELLSGERPYDDRDRERIRAGEEVAPRGGPEWDALPPPLRHTILRALRTRPEDRFPDAAAFAEELSAAAADDDRTILEARPVPVAAPAPPPDATVAAPAAPPPRVEAPAPRPAEPRPAPPSDSRPPVMAPPPPPAGAGPVRPARSGGMGKVLAALAAVLVLAALAWAMTRGGGDDAPDPAPTAAAAGADAPADTGALAREFEGVEGEAARRELEGGAAPAGGAPAATPGAPARDEAAERAAAAAVQRTVVALNDSWVNGDMDAHLANYAEQVDFYGAADAPRSRIRRERQNDLRTFNQNRQIRVLRQAVTFPEPGRARALVDKEWTFEGDRQRRTGAGRQELILVERGGRWVVVSEKMLETTRSRVERR
jgi:predicted Ser/Thr protein kinase